MRVRRRLAVTVVTALLAALTACATDAPAPTTPAVAAGSMAAAPYLYAWGDPPAPETIMAETGARWFTLAFVLAGDGCTPTWDGTRPLTGGTDEHVIEQLRAAGGDVIPSFGGATGAKLGLVCATAQELAGAYQQVVDAFAVRAIDLDLENDEVADDAAQDRVLAAVQIVKQNNPELVVIVTIAATATGTDDAGTRLIERAAELGVDIDVFTAMTFDFGADDVYADSVTAIEGFHGVLRDAYGWDDETAYRHQGLSGMIGLSDVEEQTSPQTWTRLRDWAAAHRLARFTFWAVNRDRPCPDGGVRSDCSGIDQPEWEFTRITAGYNPAP